LRGRSPRSNRVPWPS